MAYLSVSFLAFGDGNPDLKTAEDLFVSGHYADCISQARKALAQGQDGDGEEWAILLAKALLTTGQYPEARSAITNALAQERSSIRLFWEARQVFLANGDLQNASDEVEKIVRLASRHTEEYREPPDLVAFGQAVLLEGADPKRVLDTVFAAARKSDPASREAFLAIGNLALEKHDFALAAKRFQEGLKALTNDPDLHFGLARAYEPSDPALMLDEVEAALNRNSNHVGSLLLLADHAIDAEDYDGAREFLDRTQGVNPWHPEAWAYRAVLAHLQNQPDAEAKARQTALKFWPSNPAVDYVIGLKLSQKYRFAEGAGHQRQALAFDAAYLPAQSQLAQDLLRLGDETRGWNLAQDVQKHDAYDVEAYNLSELHDKMRGFATLTNGDFILRMNSREAQIYGAEALALLQRARSNLCAKYGVQLTQPTVVEIFPDDKDFAVRTFGMPGNPGYLGVCFGRVVTANSPAAHPGQPVNWQDVLWHEFCHVVTLQISHNKMPRWLSEGISVYEERQANPAWGERMNPDYRGMILGDELTPISKLSGAFLAPRSASYLQFAYYESSLVVEYLVQRFGLEQLKGILVELGEGAEINQAIQKHTEPMATLESNFAAYAKNLARSLAPGLDWQKPQGQELLAAEAPDLVRTGTNDTGTTSALNGSTNFWLLTQRAQALAQAKQWRAAKAVSERLVRLYPEFTGADSAYRVLAAAHRELGETNEEKQVLAVFAAKDNRAIDAYRRLMELCSVARDWAGVEENARRYLAVDPLVALPHRFLAQASEQLGQDSTAIAEYQTLLELDPADPAEIHFRLARLLHRAGDPQARRQVLEALEDAPRYRAALRLLLEINGEHSQVEPPINAAE